MPKNFSTTILTKNFMPLIPNVSNTKVICCLFLKNDLVVRPIPTKNVSQHLSRLR